MSRYTSYADVKLSLSLLYNVLQRRRSDGRSLPLQKLRTLASLHKTSVDILIYGDSVSERVSRFDADKRPLHRMLEDVLIDRYTIHSITHSAYSIKVYYLLTLVLLSVGVQPAGILLPVNLRSFSPQWHENPLFQCSRHVEQLCDFLDDMADIDVADLRRGATVRSFLRAPVDYPFGTSGTVADFQKLIMSRPRTEREQAVRKRAIFVFHYMNRIAPSHPMLDVLRRLVALSEHAGIRIMAYFTPVNYMAGIKHVGDDFREVMLANKKLITDSMPHTPCLDCSTSLAPEFFFHEDEPTEHLNDRGRATLTDALVRAYFTRTNQ